MPTIFCKESKKHNLIYQLPLIFTKIQQRHRVPAGDFPDCTKMQVEKIFQILPSCQIIRMFLSLTFVCTPFQEKLLGQDFSKFKTLKPSLMASLDKLLTSDIANLVPLIQRQDLRKKSLPGVLDGEFLGTFRPERYKKDSLMELKKSGRSGETDFVEWAVEKYKPKHDEVFFNLGPHGGKLSATKVKEWMTTTLLPNSVLAHIWRLSDVDGDGMLDNEEFALAAHLIEGKLEGHWLPRELPSHLVPPSKRQSSASDDKE